MRSHALLLLIACVPVMKAGAAEDIEFVAEHLAELPMDNRFASLPIWGATDETPRSWSYVGGIAFARTTAGNLEVSGPMISAAARHALNQRWTLGAFAFFDLLSLSGDNDLRPLQTLFSQATPFDRPVSARFDNLDGQQQHYGVGVNFGLTSEYRKLRKVRWVGGLLWQHFELSDYRLDYVLLEGPDAGLSGQIDFDANYSYITPFFGLELTRRGARWETSPHVLAAWPYRKHGVVGHITGPGFNLHGDTESAGHGAHIGDPSLTIGFDVTYLPAHLTVDLGTVITQRLLEPLINKGIDTNWVLSCQWRF